jgi:hypothetical protein
MRFHGWLGLIVNGVQVGERKECRGEIIDDRIKLDEEVEFPPVMTTGAAVVCMFEEPDGPWWKFEFRLDSNFITPGMIVRAK